MAKVASTARSWFDLVRVFNLPIPLAGMLAGAYASPITPSWRVAALLVAAVLGCAVTQSFNDYEDRDVDRQHAPFRPLPAGRLRPRNVLLGGHLFAVLGALLTAAVEPLALVIVAATFILTRYYPAAKRHTALNHLMMPAALAMTPLYGSLMVHGVVLPLAIVAAVSIFFLDINMNVVGAFKDLWNASTFEHVLPAVWGPRPAVVVALGCGIVGIAVQAAAVFAGWARVAALLPLGLALIMTIQSRLKLYRHPSPKQGYQALGVGRLSECLSFPALCVGVLPLDHGMALVLACLLLALYTQTIIPENVLPEEADRPLTSRPGRAALSNASA
jgi:4-hydroxybenzoate polyprenyltransferase